MLLRVKTYKTPWEVFFILYIFFWEIPPKLNEIMFYFLLTIYFRRYFSFYHASPLISLLNVYIYVWNILNSIYLYTIQEKLHRVISTHKQSSLLWLQALFILKCFFFFSTFLWRIFLERLCGFLRCGLSWFWRWIKKLFLSIMLALILTFQYQ